ncbi:unnamed protein product [Mytilus edulis]|uniref:PHR domain-containing protein n=1 Tax=Mytilus edulis TaxID=6550 RepID=A0A8S3TER2_MYTED|nr:unnamed protein product [Mytilus edulis]
MCVSINHRRCEKVLSIENAAIEYGTTDKVKDLRTQLSQVDHDVKAIIKDRASAKENIEKEHKQKQKDLETIFSDLVAKIKHLKIRREAELLKIYNEAKETIDTSMIIFQNKQKNIENEKQILEAAVNIGCPIQCSSYDRKIELCGFLSYLCHDGLSTCDVTATVKHDTTDLVVVSNTIDSKVAENKMVKIEFPKLVKLLANNKYNVVVLMKGPDCYYGDNGKTVVDSNGVVFTFENSPLSENNTNTESGQIPGFLFRIPV